jgi:hypothetical protein
MRPLKSALVCVLAFALVFPPVTLTDALSPPPANAGWFDKFTGSIVQHGGGSWSLQQQNHYAAGGFSVRFPTKNNQLLSFTAPKISVGCGGIDAFWGAFSFLDPEYLVQMLRNILQAAPAFAFKLALEAMCEPCSAILAELMAIAEAMNALAIDECGISNAIANTGAKKISELLGWKADKGDTDGSGVDWLVKGLKDIRGHVTGFVQDVKEMLKFKFCSGVDADFKDGCEFIYTSDGTIWARVQEWETHMLKSEDRFSDDEIALFRSLLGDITFTPGKDTNDKKDGGQTDATEEPPQAKIQPAEACTGATVTTFFNVMIATEEEAANAKVPFWSGGSCGEESLPDSLKVGRKAVAAVDEISAKMQTDRTTALSAQTIDLISRNAIPVYKILNLFSIRNRMSGGPFMSNDEIDMVVKVSAIGHASYLLEGGVRKAYQQVTTVMHELKPVFAAVQGADSQFDSAKLAFDTQVIIVQKELHQRESTEMDKYRENLNSLMNVITVQRALEERLYAPMYSMR